MTLFFRFYMFIWDNMIVEVCAKERKKKKIQGMKREKQSTKPISPFGKLCSKVRAGIEWLHSAERVSSHKPAGQSRSLTFRHYLQRITCHSQDGFAHRHVLPAAPHFFLRYLQVNRHNRLSLCSSLLLVWKTSRVAAAVCLLKLHVAP